MTIINMHQAKTELSNLVARAEAGEEILIARRNKPVVKLMPVSANQVLGYGSFAHLRGKIPDSFFFDPLPEQELLGWEGRGFHEDSQSSSVDLAGLVESIDAGKEFTVKRGGKAIARVVPIPDESRAVLGYGMLAHLRGKIPPDLFLKPMSEEELKLWEGSD